MNRELGKDIPPGDGRKSFLSDNCEEVVEKGYMKRFKPEELAQMKESLSETAISINDIEEEKRESTKEFTERLKPLKEEKSRLLSGLKNKAEFVNEKCFKFVDLDAKEVGFYNEEGDLIESRPAFVNELQGNLFIGQRTGTNG